jgi:hypothetical protein
MRISSVYAEATKLAFITLALICLLAPSVTCAGGVTVITHGYDGDVTGWIAAMAEELPVYYHARFPSFSTNVPTYTLSLTYSNATDQIYYSWQHDSGGSPLTTDNGEIIVKVDWSQMAGSPDPFSSAFDISTSRVARALTFVLSQTNTLPDLKGHALAEFPLHLIGHSRGGSLMSETSRLLGTNGVWVDHLTTLDPHPLNNDGNNDSPITTVDAPVHTYANVLFHDNYWQDVGGFLDPHGEPVAGAYVRQLSDSELTEGYNNDTSIFFYSYDHSNVHLWYYGSMDLHVPTSYDDDGFVVSIDATMRTNWWVSDEDQGYVTGFYYGLIGGGNRLSTDMPLGAGFPAIVDGFNQWWDLGAGNSANRVSLGVTNAAWPSIIKFNVIGTNAVLKGQPIATKFYYQYGGASSNVTAQFYLAGDFNPFNTNSRAITQLLLPKTGMASVFYDTPSLDTTTIVPGLYALYAKISDGSFTRYLYTPELVTILANIQQPVLDIAEVNGTALHVTVNGSVGQTVTIQTSPDLKSWLPLVTNTLTTGSWNYTNNAPSNFSKQFYRALLMP